MDDRVAEFMRHTKASKADAVSCLQTWSWDVKKAITDYNDMREKYSKEDLDSFEYNISAAKDAVKNKRPALVKADAVDIQESNRKVTRGISRATDNVNLVQLARSSIANDYLCNKENSKFNLADSPDFTFYLPNINTYPEEFRKFLEKDLIESSTLSSLQQSQILNWWEEKGICQKLWPLVTTGDGNCLLHAASLGMWGFHDRKLTLRSALHDTLSKGQFKSALYRRWRFQQTRYNKMAGFVYSEKEWSKEWFEVVSMASTEPRTKSRTRRISTNSCSNLTSSNSVDDCAIYESLEEIHILALAHVLRRTIIVISDTVLRDLNGEAMSPVHFGGIYFPFEIESTDCYRGPLILAYDMAHFSALVPMDTGDDLPNLIPLVSSNNIFLPIQFCIDPGENFNWSTYDGAEDCWALIEREQLALLKEYLDIEYISTNPNDIEIDFSEEYTDEELNRFSEAELIIPTTVNLPDTNGTITTFGKSHANNRTTKQLQNVARSFGSIGKNMGKKIKKNIGSITRIGSNKGSSPNGCKNKHSLSTNSFTASKILCARLRFQKSIFQEEMIKNYLDCARNRFEASKPANLDSDNNLICATPPDNLHKPEDDGCICIDCNQLDSKQESNDGTCNGTVLRYDTGNSRFYTQVDSSHHEKVKNLQPTRKPCDPSLSLYLSNSTFYNDHQTPEFSKQQISTKCKNIECVFFGTKSNNYYCSKCYRNASPVKTVYPTITAIIGEPSNKIISDI